MLMWHRGWIRWFPQRTHHLPHQIPPTVPPSGRSPTSYRSPVIVIVGWVVVIIVKVVASAALEVTVAVAPTVQVAQAGVYTKVTRCSLITRTNWTSLT